MTTGLPIRFKDGCVHVNSCKASVSLARFMEGALQCSLFDRWMKNEIKSLPWARPHQPSPKAVRRAKSTVSRECAEPASPVGRYSPLKSAEPINGADGVNRPRTGSLAEGFAVIASPKDGHRS